MGLGRGMAKFWAMTLSADRAAQDLTRVRTGRRGTDKSGSG